ncbi:FMN-binding protein [Chloroflexota bacterium]
MSIQLKKLYPILFVILVVAIALSLLIISETTTRAALEAREDQETLMLIQEIFPETSFYTFNKDTEIYTLYNNGRREIGYALYGEDWGYRSKIAVLVGLEDKETIRGIVVTSQYEDWPYWNRLEESDFFDQFTGLNIEDCYPSYSWLPGGVDAATGATISSFGVVNAVRKAALEKIKYLD